MSNLLGSLYAETSLAFSSMKAPLAVALVGFALALGGCSSAEQNLAPEPVPGSGGGHSSVPIDQTAPINGGALYNGN